MDVVAAMRNLAEQYDAVDGLRAYHDPAKAMANRPCLLVVPPAIDWTQGTLTSPHIEWRILALTSREAGSLDAVKELTALVEAAVTADVVDIEHATPTQYSLTADGKRVPAYLCTSTAIL